MKPEAQRIAIAEACGWTEVRLYEKRWRGHKPTGHPQCSTYIVPDYVNDLNAMHEAEKVLTDEQWCIYVNDLSKNALIVSTRGRDNWYAEAPIVCHATANQRAEAFLKAIGKWTA